MSDPDYTYLDDLVTPLQQLCSKASKKILEIYNSEYGIETKSDASPVTDADYAAHDIISSGLSHLTGWPVLSEEDCDIGYSARSQWSRYWLIDPLDGTRQFISGSDGFSINIALIENHAAILGMIQMPTSGNTWYARKQGAAWRVQPGNRAEHIHSRRPAADVPVFALSPARKSGLLTSVLDAMDHETVMAGSSYKSCLVAEGSADFYPCLGPTSEWDTAAAQVIVEQAGGIMCDLAGQPLRYNRKESLINPSFIVCGDPASEWQTWFGQARED